MKRNGITFMQIIYLCISLLFTNMSARAQGWTWTSFTYNTGIPGTPIGLNEGNYGVGLREWGHDSFNLAVSVPLYPTQAGIARFANGWLQNYYTFNPGSTDYDYLVRDALTMQTINNMVVICEQVPQQNETRKLILSFTEIATVPAVNKIIYETPTYNAYGGAMLKGTDDGLIITGSVEPVAGGNRNILLIKTTETGDYVWAKIFQSPENDHAVDMVAGPDNSYYILVAAESTANSGLYQSCLIKTDLNGAIIWKTVLSNGGNDFPQFMTASIDGNLLISGTNLNEGKQIFAIKADLSGSVLWRKDYNMPQLAVDGRSIAQQANGEIAICGTRYDSLQMQSDILFMKTSATGDPIVERIIGRNTRTERGGEMIATTDGGYILAGTRTETVAESGPTYIMSFVVKLDSNGIILPGLIKGNIFRDFNLDCTDNNNDAPLQHWIVEAVSDTLPVFSHFDISDANGNYEIACPVGTYHLEIKAPSPYWAPCLTDTVVTVGYLDTALVDFGVQTFIDCPCLTVNHYSTNIRPCEQTYFSVNYSNLGTATAVDAFIDFKYDQQRLTYVSSTIPVSAQNGDTLRFDLGDLEAGSWGDFNIIFQVACDTGLLGLVACTEALIYPNDNCLTAPANWSGAFVNAQGTCDGDSVRFILRNTGVQQMSALKRYIVIEDAVLLMQGQFKLNAAEELELAPLPADGTTYLVLAEQESNAPYSADVAVAVDGCNTGTNTNSTGFFNQFAQNSDMPFLSVYCPTIVGSYDPNEKQAYPTGFGEEHGILPNTDITYQLHFQNTGTDTAFRVILLDTLSPLLDPITVRPGASSHPYKFEIDPNGALRFTFYHINLPDSSENLAGSQGYVEFKVSQRADNPVGSRIENRAGIYFDFNPVVMTNTVFHTIRGPLFEVVAVHNVSEEQMLEITAFPNPFAERVQIQLKGDAVPEAVCSIYNTNGQLVKTIQLLNNQAILEHENLTPGAYLLIIKDKNTVLGTAKIIAN